MFENSRGQEIQNLDWSIQTSLNQSPNHISPKQVPASFVEHFRKQLTKLQKSYKKA